MIQSTPPVLQRGIGSRFYAQPVRWTALVRINSMRQMRIIFFGWREGAARA
jgi:hypothetical protein